MDPCWYWIKISLINTVTHNVKIFLFSLSKYSCTTCTIPNYFCWNILTWNSLTNWANINCCRSVLLGAVRTSGTVLWTRVFFWPAVPSKWQSKPAFPGNWKRWSWGPNGPMLSSGHTVLGPTSNEKYTKFFKFTLLFNLFPHGVLWFDLNHNTWHCKWYMCIRFIRTSSRKGSCSAHTESS